MWVPTGNDAGVGVDWLYWDLDSSSACQTRFCKRLAALCHSGANERRWVGMLSRIGLLNNNWIGEAPPYRIAFLKNRIWSLRVCPDPLAAYPSSDDLRRNPEKLWVYEACRCCVLVWKSGDCQTPTELVDYDKKVTSVDFADVWMKNFEWSCCWLVLECGGVEW
jgi:hypothetical protein